MSTVDIARLRMVRRFTKAGVSDCKESLSRNRGDTYLAIREMLTEDDIRDMYRRLRIRSFSPNSVSDPPTSEEVKIVTRLYRDLTQSEMVPWWRRWMSRLLRSREVPTLPDGWTDDMTFSLPPGVTEDQIVTCVLDAALEQTPDSVTETRLRDTFGLDEQSAALARDRVYGGVLRAATGNIGNCPIRTNDPLAWLSFQRATKDPSLVAKVYPQFLKQ
jgi:hypothetical protein